MGVFNIGAFECFTVARNLQLQLQFYLIAHEHKRLNKINWIVIRKNVF